MQLGNGFQTCKSVQLSPPREGVVVSLHFLQARIVSSTRGGAYVRSLLSGDLVNQGSAKHKRCCKQQGLGCVCLCCALGGHAGLGIVVLGEPPSLTRLWLGCSARVSCAFGMGLPICPVKQCPPPAHCCRTWGWWDPPFTPSFVLQSPDSLLTRARFQPFITQLSFLLILRAPAKGRTGVLGCPWLTPQHLCFLPWGRPLMALALSYSAALPDECLPRELTSLRGALGQQECIPASVRCPLGCFPSILFQLSFGGFLFTLGALP